MVRPSARKPESYTCRPMPIGHFDAFGVDL
jgi:hypothetical protein